MSTSRSDMSRFFVTEAIEEKEPWIDPWHGFDLDKTLAKYDTWQGHEHIGEPIEPMVSLVKMYLAEGMKVKIFTARVSYPSEAKNEEVRAAIRAWCLKHIGQELEVTNIKDLGMRTLYDDRARQVVENEGVVVGSTLPTNRQEAFTKELKAELGQQ